MNRFRRFIWKVSKNNTKQCFVLKCDIRKFFASIDHYILIKILKNNISDTDTIWLLNQIISSFSSIGEGKGLPLGNLTSQLLVNIYMNEFDKYIKHKLKIKYYIRYADDFVILSDNKLYLDSLIQIISTFLQNRLELSLHPDKVFIKTIYSGIDFLGWVHFYDHRILRTSTKKRMFKNLKDNLKPGTTASYIGILRHGNTHKLNKIIDTTTYRV